MKLVFDNAKKKLITKQKKIERNIKIDDKMKTFLNEIKTEKNEIKNFDKTKELEIELVKIKYASDADKLQNVSKEFNIIHVV